LSDHGSGNFTPADNGSAPNQYRAFGTQDWWSSQNGFDPDRALASTARVHFRGPDWPYPSLLQRNRLLVSSCGSGGIGPFSSHSSPSRSFFGPPFTSPRALPKPGGDFHLAEDDPGMLRSPALQVRSNRTGVSTASTTKTGRSLLINPQGRREDRHPRPGQLWSARRGRGCTVTDHTAEYASDSKTQIGRAKKNCVSLTGD